MSSSPKAYQAAHLRAAEQILAHYDGADPFPAYLKRFFQVNRKFGSKDRRQVTAFCYAFFRLGYAMPEANIRDRMLLGWLLTEDAADPALAELVPGWKEIVQGSRAERIRFAETEMDGFSMEDVFPMPEQMSESVDSRSFILSHFEQRDVFIRMRPGRERSILKKAEHLQMPMERVEGSCFRLPAGTRLEELGMPDADFVVQDLSSQQTAAFLPDPGSLPAKPRIWDACAGSGGKSIMMHDFYPGAQLTASDVRRPILQNLLTRFRAAGIESFEALMIDLSEPDIRKNKLRDAFPRGHFNLILADVPCSGSGTWGRDPWAMGRISASLLKDYVQTQRAIMDNLVQELAPGAFLLYLTCSVYRDENEDMTRYLQKQYGMHCLRSGIIAGYEKRADTMYAALFTSPH